MYLLSILRKQSFRLVLFLAVLPFFLGCVTYGRYEPKTPVKERCLLELASDLSITRPENIKWIGEFWRNSGTTVISFPSGTHSLAFSYQARDYTFRSQYREEWIEYSGNAGIKFDFEAGHHYKILAYRRTEGNNAYIEIEVKDLGTNTSLFHNGVYTGGVAAMDVHFGSGGLTYGTIGLGFGYRVILDIGTPLELSVNGAVDGGIGPGGNYNPHSEYDYDAGNEETVYDYVSASGVGGMFAGVFGYFYIPRTNVSIGAGLGYRAEVPISSPYDPFHSPFVRGELRFGTAPLLGVYYEYYREPAYFNLFNNQETPVYPNIFKKWGVGLFLRM
jgi:hypothetical protein